MKYRVLNLNCDHLLGKCCIDYAIQVKKWYGWVTIRYIFGELDYVNNKVEKILYELEHD